MHVLLYAIGGSLLLSTDGVCLIDDVIGLKKEALKRLQTSTSLRDIIMSPQLRGDFTVLCLHFRHGK